VAPRDAEGRAGIVPEGLPKVDGMAFRLLYCIRQA